MSKFKVGDVVECINAFGDMDLSEGAQYTVTELGIINDVITVSGIDYWHSVYRFELVANNTLKKEATTTFISIERVGERSRVVLEGKFTEEQLSRVQSAAISWRK